MAIEENNVEERPTERGGVEENAVGQSDTDNQDEQEEVVHESAAEKEAREKREQEEREFRAKRRKLIPPFVMLFAGALASITMRIMHYETRSMLIILLCVLVGFYIAGSLIKYMLDKFEEQIEEAGMEEGDVVEKDLTGEDRSKRRPKSNEKDE